MDLKQRDIWKDKIISAIVHAANPVNCVENVFNNENNEFDIKNLRKTGFSKFHLISIGKAAVTMAEGLINQFGDDIAGGVIIHKSGYLFEHDNWHDRFVILGSSHPVPDQRSINAANEIINYLSKLKETDFVYFLISGGGSALMTLPENKISLEDMMRMNQLLLDCGADINEINCIRKHIDQVKGGKLISKTLPAGFCTLILSDVLGDPVDVIASGPTVADNSTYEEALAIIEKYKLQHRMPHSIFQFITDGSNGIFNETVKEKNLPEVFFAPLIIGGNRNSLEAAKQCASDMGFFPLILSDHLVGEAKIAAKWIIEEASKILQQHEGENKNWCFLCGGETTVTINGSGLGGRNLELALAAVEDIEQLSNAFFVTFATDGEDGPTDAAGAWICSETYQKAREAGLSVEDFLENNNSYHFFDEMGQLIKTGSSGTNVNDICFLIVDQ